MSVWLSSDALSIDAVSRAVAHPGAGAIVLFLGVVREENEGRAVTRLDYSAYEPMAVAEMKRIVLALEAERPGVRVAVAHRIGELQVGDLAVVCAASSKHRGDAFLASRAIIDRIKAEVPIWKREHGPDGAAWVGWVDARCTTEGHGHGDSTIGSHLHGRHGAHAHGEDSRVSGETPKTPAAANVRVVTITVSDTRTADTDSSGRALVHELGAFHCVRHVIVRDEAELVRAEVRRAIEQDRADAVVLTGGTGISPRDATYEALTGLFDKTLDGFGEAFRRLSWDAIGPRAMLSRATAGVVGHTVVFALPGSTNAVTLGARELVAKTLGHAVEIARGTSTSEPTKEPR